MHKNLYVYIIIANWKQYRLTKESINSIKKSTYKNYKIILIDNEFDKYKLKKLKKDFPQIKIIQNKKNLGFSKANNQGIDHAIKHKADYILLLNNDTEVKNDFLTKLVNYSQKNKDKYILNPKILYNGTNKIWAMGGNFSLLTGIPRMIGQGKPSSQYSKVVKADYASGCALFASAKIFKKVGLLNEIFFAYYEDTDFSFRAKNTGYKIKVVPESVIWHKVSQSTKHRNLNKLGPFQSYLYAKNGLLFGYLNLKGLSRYYYLLNSISMKALLYLIYKCEGIDSKKEYMRGLKDGLQSVFNMYYKKG